MLYDPKWESPVSLKRLISWLETMPARQTYVYHDCGGACLYSRYLIAQGLGDGLTSESPGRQNWLDLHDGPFFNIAFNLPHTFGGALKRARKALA